MGLFTSQAEIRNYRASVKRTIEAVMNAVAWERANRAEATKMIAAKFKVSQSEAERSYQTMTAILSADSSVNIKKSAVI